MNYVTLGRIAGSFLLLGVASVIGLGSKALWNGRPSDWPDLVASDAAAIATSRWALAIAAILTVCAVGNFMNARWGFAAATIALVLLIAVLFWGHYVLFGNWSLSHMITNVVVAGLIVVLLRYGSQVRA